MIKKSNSTVRVNLSHLKKNVESLKQNLDNATLVMAVVKADAYGHGAGEVALSLEPQVDAFAVNDIHEGIQLRETGINNPVLVFEPLQKSLVLEYESYNLMATISSEEHFEMLPAGAAYHLNFDTGMGRLGFHPSQAQRVAALVEEHPNIRCKGIYSHFATADNPGSDLVEKQHRRFEKVRSHFSEELTTHISNTGATAFYKNKQYDMVRLGIGMYGYPPGNTDIEGIEPVLSWKTRLVQVKRIEAGEAVSYGARWKAYEDGFIGIVPVGYDDGLKRCLSGNLFVKIASKSYQVVGTITMNYSMIFLNKDRYSAGEEVQLLYSGSTAGDWAQKIDTIPYEILTGINPRIPREYQKGVTNRSE